MMIPKLAPVAIVSVIFVACTGGSDGGSSSSSSSGGSSSGSTSSGGSSGNGPDLTCTEFAVGSPVPAAIGGSTESQVTAQSVSDYGAATAKQVDELRETCRDMAVLLGASSADQSSANSQTEARDKMRAWCALAVASLGSMKAKAGGTITVTAEPSVCRFSVNEKAACQGRCTGGAPCDVAANPMACTGGTLTNGFCEGGRLQGGCAVDAKCDGSCDASVAAKATCATPTVAVSSQGAADPTAAASVVSTLEAQLPTILALTAHCKAEAELAGTLTGNTSAVTDIKPACIPPLVRAVSVAAQDVQRCLEAASALVGSVQ